MLMLIIGIGHPIFTACLLNYIGDGLLSEILILKFVPALFWVDALLRIGKEQAVLVEKFGDNYHDYMKRTGRFSPKI
jgi:protein-S-isoprenylcysteine O-methyltransferase Ste14